MEQNPYKKLIVAQLVKFFFASHGSFVGVGGGEEVNYLERKCDTCPASRSGVNNA
jgi:hypothetical protein